ncbi:AmmeMemoRadiSam system radical SAM enzyme [Bowdeniella massiliensis]|uniref:AmmeMemoRadiSam system radical SAM enzyme n=1 Tax=Bowdeniella massiliensis TaxID=2932264 RepID=UPI002027E056|nr:AmmeMemoRadiSam system radical SAM enzyme [Bowdeniella massiliensis]
MSAPAKWWSRSDDGRVRCEVCPRYCTLRDGQRGYCFVRMNVGGQLVLDTYGRSSGFAIDPIEKKPLNHFLPGSRILSFGTAGCNLGCKFCQNWTISTSRHFDSLASVASPSDIAEAALAHGCTAVAFTYNDPVIFAEYAIDTAAACRERGIRPVAVTAGYVCDPPREEFFAAMDATNIDLKGFTDDFYRKITGGRLATVLETLEHVAATSCHLEITTLVIEGHNDSDTELAAMSRWIVEHLGPDIPHHFSAFHPDHRMRDVPPTSPATLSRARQIAMDGGERFVYTGNVYDPRGQSTFCPACDHLVIERNRYRLGRIDLSIAPDGSGSCAACSTPIPVVFA